MKHSLFALIAFFVVFSAFGQEQDLTQSQFNGQQIRTAVPFLNITQDARAGATGETGVASTPDAASIYWNIAKVAQSESTHEFMGSVTPWLRNLNISDVNLFYLAGYSKFDVNQGLAYSLRYFSIGEVVVTGSDANAQSSGSIVPYELSLDAGYSRMLSRTFSLGLTAKFIRSDITRGENTTQTGNSFAVDIGGFWQKPMNAFGKKAQVNLGFSLANIGAKISYSNTNQQLFLPSNMKLGGAFNIEFNEKNNLTYLLDINKLIVPTDAASNTSDNVFSGIVNSFSDAEGGFSEEIEEINIGTGLDYNLYKILNIRSGFFYENNTKGGRQYVTLGGGVDVRGFIIDFSYILSTNGSQHPVSNTPRFSIRYNIEGDNGWQKAKRQTKREKRLDDEDDEGAQ